MDIQKIYSAESVGIGHPDKICDQISDAILDEALKQDANSHVACEVAAMNRLIVVGGEIKTNAIINVQKCVWDVIKPLGYDEHFFTIISNLNVQSNEINERVSANHTINAGDQGITIGYATNEYEKYFGSTSSWTFFNFLPIEIVLANSIVNTLNYHALKKDLPFAKYLKFDTKSQIELTKDNNQIIVKKLILALQHEPFPSEYSITEWKQDVLNFVVCYYKKQCGLILDKNTIEINDFTIGGPVGDSGLTGRKLVVDNYGPDITIGGGAFSGKDFSKVDRSGAYIARWIAKNIVANHLADKCLVQLAWEIGKPEPDNIFIETYGSNKIAMNKIYELVFKNFNQLNLDALIKQLSLSEMNFIITAKQGHFTDINYPWEKIIELK